MSGKLNQRNGERGGNNFWTKGKVVMKETRVPKMENSTLIRPWFVLVKHA